MLLQRLKEYADTQLALPPTLYSEVSVRYIIELDATGRLLNPEPLDTADPANPRTKRGVRREMPVVQRSAGIRPLLLADNAEYTFGLARESSRMERVVACNRAYRDLLDRCADATNEPAVRAVRTFLNGDPLGQLRLPDDFDRGATLTFRVDGVFPTALPSVQAFWAAVNDPARDDVPIMQCIVCGHERPVLERLQAKVKGVPGGQTSGTAIISANADAFESYGLRASLIAPTCADCGERFTKAINALLENRANRIVIGGSAFIFWTRTKTDFSFVNFFADPQPEEVRALLETVHAGRRLPEVDDTAFYATVLSGSGGRTVVRDWIDTTIGEVRRNLATWFERQRIIGPGGDEPRPLGLYALAAATVRDPQKDLAPPTPKALLRSALTGAPLPHDLLYQAVRRNRAEQTVTRQRAALIKLVLLAQPTSRMVRTDDESHVYGKEDALIKLNPNHASSAYHCGRLLAVLEDIQRAAVPGITDTVVSRFYGTASSAPGSVFPRLVRGAIPHLAKLERDKRGAWLALTGRLEEIQGNIGEFPRTLTLDQQGLFALGFFHQRAHDRAQRRMASERRKAGLATSNDADLDETVEIGPLDVDPQEN